MSHLEGKLVAICRYFVGGSPFRRRPGKSRSTAVWQNLSASLTGQIQSNNGNRFPLLVCLLAFGLLVTSSFGSAHADDFLWTGNGGNNTWSNADNWLNTGNNQTGVPGVTDHAIFDSIATTGGASVGNVTVTSSGQWNLSDAITTSGSITNDGEIVVSGNLRDMRLRLSGSEVNFSGQGQITLQNSNDFYWGFTSGAMNFMDSNQIIRNHAQHTISGVERLYFHGSNQTFFNEGTIVATKENSNINILWFEGNSNSRLINRGSIFVEANTGLVLDRIRLNSNDIGNIQFVQDAIGLGVFGGVIEFDLDSSNPNVVNTINLGGDIFFGDDIQAASPILNLQPTNGFQVSGGSYHELISGNLLNGNFKNLPEGAIAYDDGTPLYITYQGGAGSDIALVSTFHSDAVNFNIAGNSPDANVFFAGTRGDGGPAGSLNYNSFELLRNQQFTLGPTETMTLDNGNGTLFINQGSIFTGNGVVNGNILNSGLIRIPIVQLQTVSQTQGGVIEVSGTNFIGQSLGVSANTYVSFQGSSPSGGWTPTSTVVSNQGTIGWDASLAVTGDYTQTDTGALRLFLAGEDAGVNYSQLQIGGQVDLAGTLQIVFDLEKFSIFGYQPEIGQTFDFIISGDGIILDWSTLETQVFLTEAGSQWVQGLTLSPYDSGIIGDPDRLLLIDETMFAFSLVDDGRTFRGTLMRSFSAIPEPSSLVVLGLGALFVGLRRRR